MSIRIRLGFGCTATIGMAADFTVYFWDITNYSGSSDNTYHSSRATDVYTNSSVSAPLVTKKGYIFRGWKDSNGNTFDPNTSWTGSSDLHVFSQWEKATYTVYYDNLFSLSDFVSIAGTNTNNDTIATMTVDPEQNTLTISQTSAGWITPNGNYYVEVEPDTDYSLEFSYRRTESCGNGADFKVRAGNSQGTNNGATFSGTVCCYSDGQLYSAAGVYYNQNSDTENRNKNWLANATSYTGESDYFDLVYDKRNDTNLHTGKVTFHTGSTCTRVYFWPGTAHNGEDVGAGAMTVTYSNIRFGPVIKADGTTNGTTGYTVDNSTFTLSTPTLKGYTFDGWYDGTTKVGVGGTTLNSSDYLRNMSLTSSWKLDAQTVTSGKSGASQTLDNAASSVKRLITGISASNAESTGTTASANSNYDVSLTNGKLSYTPKNINIGADTGTFYATVKNTWNQRDFTTTSAVNIVPETNMLFEETCGSFTNGSATDSSSGWTDLSGCKDTAVTNNTQSVYGYKENYSNNDTYSDGSAKQTTVTNNTSTNPTYQFTFTGTGFDIYGTADENSGLMKLKVYSGTDTSGTRQKSVAINTYYADGTLNQISLYHYECTYGTYTVAIEPSYNVVFDKTGDNTWTKSSGEMIEPGEHLDLSEYLGEGFEDCEYILLDDTLPSSNGLGYEEENVDRNGNIVSSDSSSGENTLSGEHNPVEDYTVTGDYNVTIDSVRIYNPAGSNPSNTTISNQYTADGESGANYLNLRQTLITSLTDSNFGSAFKSNVKVEGGTATTVEEYAKAGAKYEIVLGSGQSLSFKLDGYSSATNKNIHLSMRSVDGTNVAVSINNDNVNIDSATEQYFDITDYVTNDGKIVITNSTGHDISVATLKTFFTVNTLNLSGAGEETVNMIVDDDLLEYAEEVMEEAMANPAPELETIQVPVSFGNIADGTAVVDKNMMYFDKDGDEWLVKATVTPDQIKKAFDGSVIGKQYNLSFNSSLTMVARLSGGALVADTLQVPASALRSEAIENYKNKTSTLGIKNYVPTLGVHYKTTVTFSYSRVNVTDVKWFVEGNVKYEVNYDGTLTVKNAKENYTVWCEGTAKDGTTVVSKSETVTVNTSFFSRLRAFIRQLLLMPEKIEQ